MADNSLQQIQQVLTELQNRVRELEKTMATHDHSGAKTVPIAQNDLTPNIRASGSITMSTDGQTYSLGVITNPTQVLFYGFAVHTSGGSVDIRSHVVGCAQLGKSFYFQPQDSNSVVQGGLPQNIVQSSSAFTIGASQVSTVSEGHLISVGYPNNSAANIVARATVTEFSVDHVSVTVSLATDWSIVGNFVVT